MSESTTYDVVLLVEQPLSVKDAAQVRSLHQDVADPVRYHVLLPVEDAAARVHSALGSVSAIDVLATPSLGLPSEDVTEVQRQLLDHARKDCSGCVERLAAAGADVSGEVVSEEPVAALVTKVREVDAAEVIVLTRSHVVAEFFHVDWTARARRKIGVPILHLLEHENFEEQAESYGGEGITGL